MMTSGTHGTTFGGNALACAAGSIVLDELEHGLMDLVASNGAWFNDKLHQLALENPSLIEGIRGTGFMVGINFRQDAKQIHKDLLERGIITNVTHETVLRLLPPLIAERADLERFLEALREVLEK